MSYELNIQQLIEKEASRQPSFAIAAAYAVNGTEPKAFTFGPVAKGGSTSVSQDASWHIGSITKSFTSTLVMRLVGRGLLSIDAPISTQLNELANEMHPDWKKVTLRQLLSHTSGLPENATHSNMKSSIELAAFQGRREILSKMWREPLSKPRGSFAYSNVGYVLAGIVAEQATGLSWEELIVSEIADPLGLQSLGFGAPSEEEAPRGHRSWLGFRFPVAPEKPTSDNPRWMRPAGGLHLSISDLVRWGQLHIKSCRGELPGFLSQENCLKMQTLHSNSYGLGWGVSAHDKVGRIVWHNGSNTMWYAILTIFPEKDVVAAVATNAYDPKRAEKLLQEISDQLVGKLE